MTFRRIVLVLTAAVLPALLGACKPNSSSGGDIANATTGASASSASSESGSAVPTSTEGQTVVDHFGSECDRIPTDPSNPDSFAKLGDLHAATALSRLTLTGKTYSELKAADLDTALNTAGSLTILAPDNDAWNKLDPSTLNAINDDKSRLTKLLTYAVIPERLSPDQLTGTLKSLEGAGVLAKGSKPDITVGPTGSEAHIVCGNVISQNATIYVIDTVLMPPS